MNDEILRIGCYPQDFHKFTNKVKSDKKINQVIRQAVDKMEENNWHEWSVSLGNTFIIIDKLEEGIDNDYAYEISVFTGQHYRGYVKYE